MKRHFYLFPLELKVFDNHFLKANINIKRTSPPWSSSYGRRLLIGKEEDTNVQLLLAGSTDLTHQGFPSVSPGKLPVYHSISPDELSKALVVAFSFSNPRGVLAEGRCILNM